MASLFKCPEEFQQTPCDFFGYTTAGRAILLEAKQVARTSLPIGSKPGLLPHQWDALTSANNANCLSLIAWAKGPVVAIFTKDAADELSEDRKSIPWDKIPDRYKMQMAGDDAHKKLFRRFFPLPL